MIHHIELWTSDFETTSSHWAWLMNSIGAKLASTWRKGMSWRGEDGTYIVLEQSPDVQGPLSRTNPGMNHLALNVLALNQLEDIRANSSRHGWKELFADKYPHAGGKEHVALYLEDSEGFEVELVFP